MHIRHPAAPRAPRQGREHRRAERGSALLLSLMFSGILGFSLLAYLTLVSSQNLSVTRSQAWNHAMAMSEAGVEEALTQLALSATNLAGNGWTLASGAYTKQRTMADGYYVVGISNVNPPVIYSQGYVLAPNSPAYLSPRTVRVTTQTTGLFASGLVAKGQVALVGGVRTDSFDSTDPNYSTGGTYDPTKYKDNGDVGSDGNVVGTITENGGVTVYGHVRTGPNGTDTISGQAVVGSMEWVNEGNTGIQPGWSRSDMNMDFPDVTVPFTSGATPANGTIGNTNYAVVIASGNYVMSALNLSSQQKMIVTGQASLYVSGDISMSGQSFIYLVPGARLTLYCGGSASLTGNGVANANLDALSFQYYGLPSNTSLALSGNAAFTGVIYAPEAAFSMNGGGNNTYDFVGAAVASTINMNGHFHFHYDESLGQRGPGAGYTLTSWNEI